jgi:hypothetical protein
MNFMTAILLLALELSTPNQTISEPVFKLGPAGSFPGLSPTSMEYWQIRTQNTFATVPDPHLPLLGGEGWGEDGRPTIFGFMGRTPRELFAHGAHEPPSAMPSRARKPRSERCGHIPANLAEGSAGGGQRQTGKFPRELSNGKQPKLETLNGI